LHQVGTSSLLMVSTSFSLVLHYSLLHLYRVRLHHYR